MNIHVTKEDLIAMLKGAKNMSITTAMELEKKGLMKFTGNQWNENWDWVDSELQKMSDEQLYNLYITYKS